MIFRIGDKVKVIGGEYIGLTGEVVSYDNPHEEGGAYVRVRFSNGDAWGKFPHNLELLSTIDPDETV